jgi:hypothetical protein
MAHNVNIITIFTYEAGRFRQQLSCYHGGKNYVNYLKIHKKSKTQIGMLSKIMQTTVCQIMRKLKTRVCQCRLHQFLAIDSFAVQRIRF